MEFKQFYKTINFDIDNEIRTVFQATQGDTKSRGLLVDLIVGGVKTPVTTENMTFYALKPDGTRVMTVGIKEGTGFRIDFTNQTFAVPGVLLCTLVLSGTNGEKIADKKFKMTVDSSLEDGAIISEDERGILDRAFDLASDIVPRLEGLDVPLLENLEQEVILARGAEPTLGARLDGTDAQLAEKANAGEIISLFGLKPSGNVLPLPIVGKNGKFTIKPSGVDNVYISNGNLYDLLGVQDGVYTGNGLTVTIADGNIKIQGTATVATYIRLTGGTAISGTNLTLRPYQLPNILYKIALYDKVIGAGSVNIPISIRHKTSGNVISITPNDLPISIPTPISDWGAFYIFSGAGNFIDVSFKIALVPDSQVASEFYIPPQSQIVTDTPNVTSLENKSFVYSDGPATYEEWINVDVNTAFEKQYAVQDKVNKKITLMKQCEYDKSKYLGLSIEHTDIPAIRANNYRIGDLKLFNFDGEIFTEQPNSTLIMNVEWDCGIKQDGKTDFMGGKMHGDEMHTAIVATIDGKVIDIDNDENYVIPFSSFRLFTRSNMLEVDNPTDVVIAVHDKEINFDQSGITLDQKVTFAQAITVDDSYLGMMPVSRNIGTDFVSRKAYLNGDYSIKDVSVSGAMIWHYDADAAVLYNDGSGHKLEAKFIVEKTNATDDLLSIIPTSAYNKVYYHFTEGKAVTVNETWRNKVRYILNYGGYVAP